MAHTQTKSARRRYSRRVKTVAKGLAKEAPAENGREGRKSRELPIHASRKIDGQKFLLQEKLGDYRTVQVAKAEIQAEGFLVRTEPRPDESAYYLWTGPERTRQVRTLPGEQIKRVRGSVVKMLPA